VDQPASGQRGGNRSCLYQPVYHPLYQHGLSRPWVQKGRSTGILRRTAPKMQGGNPGGGNSDFAADASAIPGPRPPRTSYHQGGPVLTRRGLRAATRGADGKPLGNLAMPAHRCTEIGAVRDSRDLAAETSFPDRIRLAQKCPRTLFAPVLTCSLLVLAQQRTGATACSGLFVH
jgi:hypothetical protein